MAGPGARSAANAAFREEDPGGSRESRLLLSFYSALLRAAGHRGWWPGRTRLEIILGAILTQNTAWTNVEKALERLRGNGLLSLPGLRSCPEGRLAETIRPSGYFRQKARKVRAFLELLDVRYGGSLDRMSRRPAGALREELLAVWGIGPETADSILLYAFHKPVFVVDAYTRRVLIRHGLLPAKASYALTQDYLAAHLPVEEALYNDYHAQLVWVGQRYCRTTPQCDGCPLEPFLSFSGNRRVAAE